MPRTLPIAAALLALPHLLAVAAARNEPAKHADRMRAAFTGQGAAHDAGCLHGGAIVVEVGRRVRPMVRYYSQR